jgi:hypothetical protein
MAIPSARPRKISARPPNSASRSSSRGGAPHRRRGYGGTEELIPTARRPNTPTLRWRGSRFLIRFGPRLAGTEQGDYCSGSPRMAVKSDRDTTTRRVRMIMFSFPKQPAGSRGEKAPLPPGKTC